jgi:hypothetical protein
VVRLASHIRMLLIPELHRYSEVVAGLVVDRMDLNHLPGVASMAHKIEVQGMC